VAYKISSKETAVVCRVSQEEVCYNLGRKKWFHRLKGVSQSLCGYYVGVVGRGFSLVGRLGCYDRDSITDALSINLLGKFRVVPYEYVSNLFIVGSMDRFIIVDSGVPYYYAPQGGGRLTRVLVEGLFRKPEFGEKFSSNYPHPIFDNGSYDFRSMASREKNNDWCRIEELVYFTWNHLEASYPIVSTRRPPVSLKESAMLKVAEVHPNRRYRAYIDLVYRLENDSMIDVAVTGSLAPMEVMKGFKYRHTPNFGFFSVKYKTHLQHMARKRRVEMNYKDEDMSRDITQNLLEEDEAVWCKFSHSD